MLDERSKDVALVSQTCCMSVANTSHEPSLEEEHTVSSTSLCATSDAPCDNRPLANGYHDVVDNGCDDNCNPVNGNVHVKIVSASTNNMDVLSGGESDTGDTLSRQNNNSISSHIAGGVTTKRRGADVTYYVAKELLMSERTYKRDLELITVTWGGRVGSVVASGSEGAAAAALARACLALEPLALPAGALLARLERLLSASPPHARSATDAEEPEYKKIGELLYDYLSSTYDAYAEYTAGAGACVALVESARRRGGAAAREAAAFDSTAPLPLACLLLRPLHRLLHYRLLASELWSTTGGSSARAALELANSAAEAALQQLQHVENHATLCQLQRDIAGYDKLLVADREFLRLGCVYKHSSKGLQQRMIFLFSDVLVVSAKAPGGRFRAAHALALHQLGVERADHPHSVAITGLEVSLVFSVSTEQEFEDWLEALLAATAAARERPAHVDTALDARDDTDQEQEGAEAEGAACGALAHVCWHRAASLPRARLHLALRTQLSGYLLRKFKNSHGWQKLWVVFAMFTLFFYKSWQDQHSLASLPLLGYSVGPPSSSDGIGKDFVFKLQFKNHVYFFRADSQFTYNRWTEVLQTPMVPAHLD